MPHNNRRKHKWTKILLGKKRGYCMAPYLFNYLFADCSGYVLWGGDLYLHVLIWYFFVFSYQKYICSFFIIKFIENGRNYLRKSGCYLLIILHGMPIRCQLFNYLNHWPLLEFYIFCRFFFEVNFIRKKFLWILL